MFLKSANSEIFKNVPEKKISCTAETGNWKRQVLKITDNTGRHSGGLLT